MQFFKSAFPLMLVASLLLPSCTKDDVTPSVSEGSNVVVKVYPMSHAETRSLFEGRGRHLVKGKDAIIPLHVVVENKTSDAFTVKPAAMAIVDSEIIYRKVKKNVAAIATAGTIGGLFLTPLVAAAIGAGCGISSAKKNDRILSEIYQDAFVAPREVYPKSSLNKIMFVRESDFQSQFSLAVGSHTHMVDLSGSDLVAA